VIESQATASLMNCVSSRSVAVDAEDEVRRGGGMLMASASTYVAS
jgi:hypothetical protein